jgi:hypothetical protein
LGFAAAQTRYPPDGVPVTVGFEGVTGVVVIVPVGDSVGVTVLVAGSGVNVAVGGSRVGVSVGGSRVRVGVSVAGSRVGVSVTGSWGCQWA